MAQSSELPNPSLLLGSPASHLKKVASWVAIQLAKIWLEFWLEKWLEIPF